MLDLRPAEEFSAGHIPGAVSIPFGELERLLGEVPKGREVVAYCRGPYCVWSHRAVGALRASGRKARRLVDGVPEWNAEGLPVESESSEVSR